MVKNISTGYLRQIRKRKANLIGGSSEERYQRYILQTKADAEAIKEEMEKKNG